ncbi:beta-N-acetylglucosaminidase domain-containing protein [Streptomyces sp. NPDC059740]|uniref:beta-N-acetylglucosaminidase domain-containing protein n=1 Tax=Streptomyces sp. NPDC059740 TaxID=3346926 RepID=UPI003660D372
MHHPRPTAAYAGLTALALALTGLAPAGAFAARPGATTPTSLSATSGASTAPSITPTPQSQQARRDHISLTPSVTLVAAEDADAPALETVRAALRAAGVQRIVRRTTPEGAPRGNLTVAVGGAAATAALARLGARSADGLPAEGYALALGAPSGTGPGEVVLAGVDATGTYYAAQSLRQLLPHRQAPGARVAGTVVRDWPATALRGVIEGFYGTPWSDQARLDQLDFYGEHKMNTYVYSPKDDPYLRDKWRDPYPDDQLAAIGKLVDRARDRHVDFTYALSPGLSVCYSSEEDVKALTAKLQTLWDIGVRTFAVPLDDISYTKWNCDADEAKFGTGGGAAGAAQAYLLNRVNQEFIATHQGARPLEMVPTEYYDVKATPYKAALKEKLDDNVVVEWTGVGVIAPTMTVDQAKAAREVFGHPILTWDNYPVNDYVTDRLLLGPFTGRQQGLPEQLAGVTANPMIQPAASKIALSTVADYTWNDGAYDADRSWTAALHEMAGGDARTERALRAFADVEYGSDLNPQQAPELNAAIEEFWKSGRSAPLDAAFRTLQQAPAVLRDRLPDKGFLTDSAPWLEATGRWGTAARTALRLVAASRSGDGASAWRLRQELAEQVSAAKAPVYTDMNGKKIPVVVGDGVLDTFVADAAAVHDKALGVAGHAEGVTNLGTYQAHSPALMTDGDETTYFWSDGAADKDDHVGVDLGRVRELGRVTVAMGRPGDTGDHLKQGVLEYSADGRDWHTLETFTDQAEVSADPPAGTTARYVRARATAAQDEWVAVREFQVADPGAAKVTGGPGASAGGSLAEAADGDPATRWTAARAAQPGEYLQVTPGAGARPHTVTVLRPSGAKGASATVEVSQGGRWHAVGRLTGDYTRIRPAGGALGAVRLVWSAGGPAPQIAEVVLD